MNPDREYLYLDVKFNDSCTTVTIKIGVFMYTQKLGLTGGDLIGEEAFDFLKNTIDGKQPDLINFFMLFGADTTYEELNLELTVNIPSIHDVKFKNNKFDRKRRAFKTSMMSIPCANIKTAKVTASTALIDAAIQKYEKSQSTLSADDQNILTEMRAILEDSKPKLTPELQTRMDTVYNLYLSKQ